LGNHSHNRIRKRGKKLVYTILLNLLITVVQITGAIFANSLALLSDAFHNLSDTSSLIVSFFANKLTLKKSTKKQTFGYKRAEIIAAFINASFLLVVAAYLIFEAIDRILNKQEITVNAIIVMALAAFSILANGVSVLIIKDEADSNLNIRSAYIHLFTDMLSSIAVLLGGAMIYFFNIYLIDPILSILIAFYLIYFGWKLVIQSLKVLMQFTPENIDIEQIAEELKNFKDVKNIHHAHVWQLNDDEIMFEAHVDINEDLPISEISCILHEMKMHLLNNYRIRHTTLQPEYDIPCNKSLIYQTKEEEC
jgi:cobalt-zinc-cadmium efflux system protein